MRKQLVYLAIACTVLTVGCGQGKLKKELESTQAALALAQSKLDRMEQARKADEKTKEMLEDDARTLKKRYDQLEEELLKERGEAAEKYMALEKKYMELCNKEMERQLEQRRQEAEKRIEEMRKDLNNAQKELERKLNKNPFGAFGQ